MRDVAPTAPRAARHWLLATAAITVAPHATQLPIWLSGLCALLLVWRALLTQRDLHAPARLLLPILMLATAAGIRLEYGHFFGKDPGTALLAALLCLKLLEGNAPRDHRVAILLSFFLQLTLFFYDQSVIVALAALGGALFAVLALLCLHDPGATIRTQMRAATLLVAHALPFMVVLFVLFPRVQGPLWGLPADAYSGRSGLSETMQPGSISNLILSGEIAFRAQFDGEPPPPSQRYWRGPVLTHFDGRTWRPAHVRSDEAPPYTPAGRAYAYRLTLEPHNQPWVLALDYPARGTPQTRHADDFRLLATTPVRTRTRFELLSYPDTPVGLDERREILSFALRLPAGSNPRARDLAAQLAPPGTPAGQILQRILAHLRDQQLTYTLQPARLGPHAVDDFLFETREGFCEHFSAAFVFLARAAGLPARVVTGYQGGEINRVDGSLIVRQSDAHAWAEVWLPERGWVRVDPTALAAPERISSGLAAALPEGSPLPFMLRSDLAWLRDLRHQWDALSNSWNQWVLGYNADRQRELLTRLGFARPDWERLALLLTATLGLLLSALFAWALVHRVRRDPIDRAWAKFCRRGARAGIQRHAWEGPADYARRLALRYPDRARDIDAIARAYARLRYGPPSPPNTLQGLRRRIRTLKLP